MDYSRLMPITQPDEIERASFAIIEQEAKELFPNYDFTNPNWPVIRRLIHSCGDFDILNDMCFSPNAIVAGLQALKNNAQVFTDTQMAKQGMSRLKQLGLQATCLLDISGVAEYAASHNCTRSKAAVTLGIPQLNNAIVAIGNAPTALLALLASIEEGLKPALIIAMPVGFVNAAESKNLVLNYPHIPHIILKGRKGGSPLAAATINALCCMAAEK